MWWCVISQVSYLRYLPHALCGLIFSWALCFQNTLVVCVRVFLSGWGHVISTQNNWQSFCFRYYILWTLVYWKANGVVTVFKLNNSKYYLNISFSRLTVTWFIFVAGTGSRTLNFSWSAAHKVYRHPFYEFLLQWSMLIWTYFRLIEVHIGYN